MKKTQFESLVIQEYEEETFHFPVHGQTYYELVYIWKGSGVHLLNNNRLPYKAGDLFIVCPEDEHYFEIRKRTRFTFIKFTDSYFAGQPFNHRNGFLSSSPEEMMRNKLLKEMKLKMEEPYSTVLRNTIGNIVACSGWRGLASSPLVYYQVLAVFGLIREMAARLNLRIDKGQPGKEELISYIHQHIYEPSRVQVRQLAARFHIAPGYFSAWFKRNFGVSYREYVNEYRAQLIEKRILVPSLTMKQIANEFGFTDESHLSHFFKGMRKMSPAQFRNAGLKPATAANIVANAPPE